MVSENIAGGKSGQRIFFRTKLDVATMRGFVLRKGTYLRLNVLEQNLQLYGRSPESIAKSVSPRHQTCT
jgi:hypothetical protein